MRNKIDKFDLEAAISVLTGKFEAIEEVYLFGSRRYNTESVRSDIDILVTVSSRIKPSDLRDYIIENCTALDIFILDDGKATSVANESFISTGSNAQLIKDLNALKLFDRAIGKTEELANYTNLELDTRVQHELTSLPNSSSEFYKIDALIKYFEAAQKHGLPAKPYMGQSADEVSDLIIKIIRNLISANAQVTGYGQAKTGWTNNLKDEYDFQNLLWITVKPWLPGLGREEVELKYDGNEKRSDFNLFNNQLVIELKHIKNDGDKRNIVKTLSGLKDFYTQHPNIRVLIFGILVDHDVDLDDKKWETDFSYLDTEPFVKTIIVRNT